MRREDSPWIQRGWTSEWWKLLTKGERQQKLAELTDKELDEFFYDWRVWARDEQLAPDWDWDTWLMLTGRGWGKALDLSTPIPTPRGWTTMGEIKTGDLVFDEAGQVCRVTKAHDILHDRDCYRVTFSDGSEIIADGEHLWATETGLDRKAERRGKKRPLGVRTTVEIAKTLHRTDLSRADRNHSIPVAGALQMPHALLSVEPYLLGAWLGDGSTATGEITTADPEVVESFVAAGESVGRARAAGGRSATYPITAGYVGSVAGRAATFTGRLRALGVIGNKHIPLSYLRAAYTQRLELLQGLMDTDGYAEKSKAEFCTTRRELADGVFELVASLGMIPRFAEDRAKLNGRDCGPRYRITFRPRVPVFRLARKQERVGALGNQEARTRRRYIVAVEPVASRPVRCITVNSESRLYLAGRGMIPTHNTRTAVEFLLDKVENAPYPLRIAIVGQGEDDVRNVMVEGESGFIACSRPWNKPKFYPSAGGGRLVWPNGCQAFIYSIVDTEALRGPQFHYGWCDEPMAAPRAMRERALDNLEFCLRLGEHPQLVITTTPKPDPWLREMEKQAKKPDEHKLAITRGETDDNAENLAANFLKKVHRKYGGTKKGRQELKGLILGDEEGALWTEEMLEKCRQGYEHMNPGEFAAQCQKVLVSIDPNTKGTGVTKGSNKKKLAHAAGIVVTGKIGKKRFVLADRTIGGGPSKWGGAAVRAAIEFDADEFTAEGNQGGEMVKIVLQQAMEAEDFHLPVHINWSKRSKQARAEPAAHVYDQGDIHHVGPKENFELLEMQMMYLHEEEDPTSEDFDRCDALVAGLTRHGLKKRASSSKTGRGIGIVTIGELVHGSRAVPSSQGPSAQSGHSGAAAPWGEPEL